jgi:hypothetical protein
MAGVAGQCDQDHITLDGSDGIDDDDERHDDA